jgi:hypothetical protein
LTPLSHASRKTSLSWNPQNASVLGTTKSGVKPPQSKAVSSRRSAKRRQAAALQVNLDIELWSR